MFHIQPPTPLPRFHATSWALFSFRLAAFLMRVARQIHKTEIIIIKKSKKLTNCRLKTESKLTSQKSVHWNKQLKQPQNIGQRTTKA